MKTILPITPIIVPVMGIIGAAISLQAATFPGTGDDVTTSLGQFKIAVDPVFKDDIKNNPAYASFVHSASGGNIALMSPILFDPQTTIGRSNPLLAGSAADSAGVVAGIMNPQTISDNQLTVKPPGAEGPNGTREVHTFIESLNLSGGGFDVKAGVQAPTRPISAGEVESLSGNSGDPNQDFAASSFFDVFVQVDIPGLGGFPNLQLVNVDPLLVESSSISGFPPSVVYIHGNSSAVPMYFNSDLPAIGIHRGDLFGQLTLAGHGVGFKETDVPEFEQEVETETDLPLDKNPHRHVDIVDRSPGPNGVPDQGLSAVLLALAAAPLLGLHCRSRRKPAHTRLTLS